MGKPTEHGSRVVRRLAACVAFAVAATLTAAAPASAAPGPVLIHDRQSNLALCGNPGPCRPAFKLYDRAGNLIIICGDDCYFVTVLHSRSGWYVYLIGGERTGPMGRRP